MINCFFEDGEKAVRGLRHITVGAVAVNEKHQILLIKRAQNIHNGGKYAIPGGFLDRDEDTKQATLRELREESGFDGEIISLLKINDNPKRPKEDRQNVDIIYAVKVLGGEAKGDREIGSMEWFNKENLPDNDEFAFDHKEVILEYLNSI